MTNLRKKIASKAARIIKKAQEDEATPKVVDEGPEGEAFEDEEVPDEFALPEGEDAVDTEAIEEEVTEDIRKEKEEEAVLGGLGEKVDKLVETMETVVSALSDQKTILEQVLGVPAETEKEDVSFEEFKEDDTAESDEAFSPEEFGIDTDTLITGKEESMSIKSLRDARKARLARRAAIAGPRKESDPTLTDQLKLDEMKKKTFSPKAPEPQQGKVPSEKIPDMLKLANLAIDLNDKQDTWTILTTANGKDTPLYLINKNEKNKVGFATEAFGQKIVASLKKVGLEGTAKEFDAEAITKAAPVKETPKEEPVKVATKDFERRFVRAFRVVLAKMQKNMMANPLKAAFFDQLQKLGMSEKEASDAIEGAFDEAAAPQFEVAIAETEKLMGLSDEAFIELEASIGDLRTVNPDDLTTDAPEADMVAIKQQALRMRASRGSLPISTATDDNSSLQDQLSAVLPKPKLWAGLTSLKNRA